MKIPLSWIKDFVDVSLPVEEIARILTMAGLEVDEVVLVGLPAASKETLVRLRPSWSKVSDTKLSGLSWEPDKFVVAQIDEVMPHPNADRLTLCRLQDGSGRSVCWWCGRYVHASWK